ncbi:hypothetical protein KQX54_015125 [Cotesia glomerata]|uniref:Uncharacterized protein n=1 Tax=Cotesia glomerata TaxID=32391 RepID=A0AAV7IRZ9_COTGL|nr:hypothetical protein KQX54_015125 [Cotesia glomerata]
MAVIAASVVGAIKAAGLLLVGKLSILPVLIAALAYFNYDLMDPENHPQVTKNLRANLAVNFAQIEVLILRLLIELIGYKIVNCLNEYSSAVKGYDIEDAI